MISIVIPILNEEKILREKRPYYTELSRSADIYFVDGGSSDQSMDLAGAFGRVVSCRPGRAFQKNYGAEVACSEQLLFLHVDSFIEQEALQSAACALEEGYAGGCFTMRINDNGKMFRYYERAVNFRARRFGIMDGDLGLFIKKNNFLSAGRFDERPVMEDLTFSRKIKNIGPVKVLPQHITVSSRKWKKQGFVKTFLAYSFAYAQLWTGIPFYKHLPAKNSIEEKSPDYIRPRTEAWKS